MNRNGHLKASTPELANLAVVNRHTFTGPRDESYVYIGRGTPLGNNWSHVPETAPQFRVGSREEAVGRYRQWLWHEIQRGNGPALKALETLKERAVAGEKLSLACSCSPQLCHGDVIKAAIEHLAQRDREQSLRQESPSQTIFVSGSRSIKSLPAQVRDHLDRHITANSHILVGDAHGADSLVQQYLANAGYERVTVFHIGAAPRNNYGFKTQQVAGTRQTDKDTYMATHADRGLAIWDGKSPGTEKNIGRLDTDVIKVSRPTSIRSEQARADILSRDGQEDFRTIYNVPEGSTRGEHTSNLHHHDSFARDEFEHGATISDSILSIPRDPDSRTNDGSNVKIGSESHAINFVSSFVKDPEEARAKGERLYQLAERACGQWTESHSRWQTFTNIYDLVRKDESFAKGDWNGQYRTNEEKVEAIDQVLDSIALWSNQLPEPIPEPTPEEIHQYTLDLAVENKNAPPQPEADTRIQLDTAAEHDPRLLYLHELGSNSHGLATLAELTGFNFDGPQPEPLVDENQVYTDVLESAVFDAIDFSDSDHLSSERLSAGPALDATFDRINLNSLPPVIPDTLSEQTEAFLLDSLIPAVDAQLESGFSRQEILSTLYETNREIERERFNDRLANAFQVSPDAANNRQPPSREDRLNALTSLRLLVAGEYKRETHGFTRDAIEFAKTNYRLDPDQLRAAGKLKLGEYDKLINDQAAARIHWQQEHQGQPLPYRAQIARISQLELAGYKINNRISTLDPSRAELVQALNCAQSHLLTAEQLTEARLSAFSNAEEQQAKLNEQAKIFAQAVRSSEPFRTAQSEAAHNDHERATDEQQSVNRGNNPRFAYLATGRDLTGDRDNSQFGELKGDHEREQRAERQQLIKELINPDIEAARTSINNELAEHRHYFTQIAGREITTSVEARQGLQPVLASLSSVINFADRSRQRLDSRAPAETEIGLDHAPIYVSLTSNENLRIPITTLPEYDALTNAIHDCRLETSTWRTLHSPAPITGRDEEREALTTFVAEYIDFRQRDHVTSQLNRNPVFREYSHRLTDARTPEELVETIALLTKENYAANQHAQAHRADQSTPAPDKAPLTAKEVRELVLSVTPAVADKSTRTAMREILLSTVLGKEKTDRVQLLAAGKLQPSAGLSKLLENLDSRKTEPALRHFYASLHNPNPARENKFNLYEVHRLLPQFERDYLYQHALAAKYASLTGQNRSATAQPEQLKLDEKAVSPVLVAKETDSYRSYYGQADLREATLCAQAVAHQQNLSATRLDQSTIAPGFSDLEVRTVSYAVHNFDASRVSQITAYLQTSDDPHQHALGDLLSLAADVHSAGGAQEITNDDIRLPDTYSIPPTSVISAVNFVQRDTTTVSQSTASELRQAAQKDTWKDIQQSAVPDPSLLADAPASALEQISALQQTLLKAGQLQERARTAFAVRDSHFNSCHERAAAALRGATLTSTDGRLPLTDPANKETTRELVSLALDPTRPDSKQLIKDHAKSFVVIQQALSSADLEKASQLTAYASQARDQYLNNFSQIDSATNTVRTTQHELAQNLSTVYELANKEFSGGAQQRYTAVKESIERTVIGEQLAISLATGQQMAPAAGDKFSVRDLLPSEIIAQATAEAREQAWQSFEPQEIRDAAAGQTIDDRTLNLAYTVMDHVESARSHENTLLAAQENLVTFIDERAIESEDRLRTQSLTNGQSSQDSQAVERDPIDGPDTPARLDQTVSDQTIFNNQEPAGKTQNVAEQALYAQASDRDQARQQTISELKDTDSARYESLKEEVARAESKLTEAFLQIDATISQLELTRTELRVEKELGQYKQIANPVAERVNNYLKETTKEEGLKSLLEPLRHEDHVERLALTILQTAHDYNVPLNSSIDSFQQVYEIANNLFDTLRDGLERANHHLIPGMQFTAETHKSEMLIAQTNHQHGAQIPGQNGNGHHPSQVAAVLDKTHAPERILDLREMSGLSNDPLKDNPFIEQELTSNSPTHNLAQLNLNNSGSQTNAPNSIGSEHDTQDLELVR